MDIGDKEAKFLGSRQWIGSMEVGFVLETKCGIQSRVISVSSGADMASKVRCRIFFLAVQPFFPEWRFLCGSSRKNQKNDVILLKLFSNAYFFELVLKEKAISRPCYRLTACRHKPEKLLENMPLAVSSYAISPPCPVVFTLFLCLNFFCREYIFRLQDSDTQPLSF